MSSTGTGTASTGTPAAGHAAGAAYVVKSVNVDTSRVAGIEGGRKIERSRKQMEQDVRSVVMAALAPHNKEGGRPVNVDIRVDQVRLSKATENAFFGASQMKGAATLVDASTGKVVHNLGEIESTADGFRIPVGLMGVLTTKTPDKDYQQTLAGFAHKVERGIYGEVQ